MSSNTFYSIVPPVLVVLSLAGIIWFLAKKLSQKAKMGQQNVIDAISSEDIGQRTFAEKRVKERINWTANKNRALAAGGGISRFFKTVFSKFKNPFGRLKPRFKNEIRTERQKIENISDTELLPEEEVIKRVHGFNVKKLQPEKNNPVKNVEKSIKTVVSHKEVEPRIKTEIKDRLEELLIERIAVNPKDIEAYERLGEYYMEIESYEFAKECFKQVIKLDPGNKNVKYKMKRLEYLLSR